jgi:hypothetical protein
VQGLQVPVGLVLRVPAPVVGERDHLVRGRVRPHRRPAGREVAGRVLVEVVADVDDEVEVAALGEVPVGGEVAGLPVRARHQAEAEPVGGRRQRRRRPRAADAGPRAVEAEAVPVRGVRLEAADVGFHRVVPVRAGGHRAGRHRVGEGGVAEHRPPDLGVRALAGAGP